MHFSLVSLNAKSSGDNFDINSNSHRRPLIMVSFTLQSPFKMIELWKLLMAGELRDSIQGFGFECEGGSCKVDMIPNDDYEGRMDFIDEFLKKRLTLFHSNYIIHNCPWRARRVGLKTPANLPWTFGHFFLAPAHSTSPFFYPEPVSQDAHAMQLLTRISKDPASSLRPHEGYLWASRGLLQSALASKSTDRLDREKLLRGSHAIHYRAPRHLALDIRMALIDAIYEEEDLFDDIDAIWLIFAEHAANQPPGTTKVLHLLFQLTPKQDSEDKRAHIHRWVTQTLAGGLFYSRNFNQASLIPFEWNIPLVFSLGHPHSKNFSLKSAIIQHSGDLHKLMQLDQTYRLIMLGKQFSRYRAQAYSLVAIKATFKMSNQWSLIRRCFVAAFVHGFPNYPIVAISLIKASDDSSQLVFYFGMSMVPPPMLINLRIAMRTLLLQEGVDSFPVGYHIFIHDFPEVSGRPHVDALPPIPNQRLFTHPDGSRLEPAPLLSVIAVDEFKRAIDRETLPVEQNEEFCEEPVLVAKPPEVPEKLEITSVEVAKDKVKELVENSSASVKRIPKPVMLTEEIRSKIRKRQVAKPAKLKEPIEVAAIPPALFDNLEEPAPAFKFDGWRWFSPLRPHGSPISSIQDLEPAETFMTLRYMSVDLQSLSCYSLQFKGAWKSVWLHLARLVVTRSVDWSRLFVSLEIKRMGEEQVELSLYHLPIRSIAFLSPMIVIRELIRELISFNVANLSIEHK